MGPRFNSWWQRAAPPALPQELQARWLDCQAQRHAQRRALRHTPLALARFVALDLETTGPRMDRDRIISIGAIGVRAAAIEHSDCFERTLQQSTVSDTDNILIHQIGAQAQMGGADPVMPLIELLEYIQWAPIVSFRSPFDATILAREIKAHLGVTLRLRMFDLALLLPALYPNTQNDSLDDWLRQFGIAHGERHSAISDAYLHAMLLLIVLARTTQMGRGRIADLDRLERAQAWLGRRS